MLAKLARPNAKFTNYSMPRPAGPVIGPPRLQNPLKSSTAESSPMSAESMNKSVKRPLTQGMAGARQGLSALRPR